MWTISTTLSRIAQTTIHASNKMINRRKLIWAGSGLTAASSLSLGGCSEKNVNQNDFLTQRGFVGTDHDMAEFTGERARVEVGSASSRHSEVRKAFRLLWDAPRGNDHMALAEYFRDIPDLNESERNASGQVARYNEEWNTRANPLITSFFGMTNTLPSSGDQTAWCAAFVSFILYASKKPNKFSALSGSYRSYGRPTDNPVKGDIVVFRKNGPKGDIGFGHVGFYVGETDQGIKVLGGNQRAGEGSTGAVTETIYKRNGSSLSLHSFRSVPTAE